MKSEINIALLKKDFQYLKDGVDGINHKLDCKVDNDKTYTEMVDKVDNLWDSKNKLLGYMLGAGVAGGGISVILSGAVKTVFALIK